MKDILARVVEEHGTPCYLYDIDKLTSRAENLKRVFTHHFKISYAVKANPNVSILRRIKKFAESLDISSGGELARAIQAQWNPAQISFTGPGKTDAELQASVKSKIGYVIIESLNEAERLSTIALRAGTIQPVLVRISPAKMPAGFGVSMAGRPTPFGIDEEESERTINQILKMRNIPVKGFHIYSGTQCLKPDSIVENHENCIRIFRRLSDTFDLRPETLVFGSGLGIPYHEEEQALDITLLAQRINPLLNALRRSDRFTSTKLVLELGRYLIGEAGYYLTRVINTKTSRGLAICICDGGMHQHLAASGHLGSVIPRNYRMFRVGSDKTSSTQELQTYDLAGPLCTSIDRIARNVKMPVLGIGDVIAIESSGAYGLTASPMHFISHPLPKEIVVETINGHLTVTDISETPY